jgi:hypothetical protein
VFSNVLKSVKESAICRWGSVYDVEERWAEYLSRWAVYLVPLTGARYFD